MLHYHHVAWCMIHVWPVFSLMVLYLLCFRQGVKASADTGVELGMDSIQFGAPSSAGSTDSDGVPALLEKGSDNKLPEPKEQRQKQPRAGPIKPQKVPNGVPFSTFYCTYAAGP